MDPLSRQNLETTANDQGEGMGENGSADWPLPYGAFKHDKKLYDSTCRARRKEIRSIYIRKEKIPISPS